MNNTNVTARLSRDSQYNKSKKSYQQSLSPDEIMKKLDEYRQIEDINKVSLNTHIRYFTINPKNDTKEFRLGGFLTKIDKEYVILSNGKLSWSVQMKNSIFFEKMTFADLKEELEKKIYKNFEKDMNELIDENRKLKDTLKQVKKEIKKKTHD